MTDFVQDHPDGVILALDEMSLYYQATSTRVWAPVGETPVTDVAPERTCCYFYGALNVRNGRDIAMRADRQCSEYTADFIRQLLLIYSQPILLLLDRATWHKGEVTPLVDSCDRLEVMYFPVACPGFNPQEHVWSQARDHVSHNHAYCDFERLITDFETY